MNTFTAIVRSLALATAILGAGQPALAQAPAAAPSPASPPVQAEAAPPGGAWLDATPVVTWNQQGAAVPRPPAVDGPRLDSGRCADQSRPPETPADRAVTTAGWTLVGPLQVFGETSVVTAAAAGDGMCRPLGYQAFVFVRGRFAGTLSPQPMNSRTDGMANTVRLLSRDRVLAEFARYGADDALCCPSRTSQVVFSIKRSPGGSMVVVESVQTTPNPVR